MSDSEEIHLHRRESDGTVSDRLVRLEMHRRHDAGRIDHHSARIAAAEQRLAHGQVSHSEMRADIRRVADALDGLIARFDSSQDEGWIVDLRRALIFWAVPILGGGLMWAVVQSGSGGM